MIDEIQMIHVIEDPSRGRAPGMDKGTVLIGRYISIEICHSRGRESVSDSISAIGASNVPTLMMTLYHIHRWSSVHTPN